ncbi:MAG: hypothetical protein QOJ03_3097, partial [Frankiaceae bacterium]|nr:hypothetical protein [Frankiaceae bacterium]
MKLKNWAGPTALAVLVAAIVSGAVWVAHGHGSGAAASAGRPQLLHLASAGGRSGASTLAASAADSTSGGSRYVLTGSLPDGQPDDQAAWRTLQPTAADAADIADALGLTGTPQRADGGWVLRDADNRLVVRDDGGWSYGMDCAPDTPVSDQELTVACAYAYASSGGGTVAEPPADDANSSGGGSSDGSTGSGGGDPGSTPDCDPAADGCGMTIEPDPGTSPEPVPTYSPGPSDGDARGYAAPILNALGIGDADVAVYTGSPITTVQASPRVDGMVTSGWWTDLQFDGDGKLSSGDGWV